MNRKERRAARGAHPTSQQSPELNTLFSTALAHHQSGRLPEAEALYKQILANDPRHADSLHLLGVLALQVGQYSVAIDLIKQAIVLNNAIPNYYNNLGTALRESGRCEEAIKEYKTAITLDPRSADIHNNVGIAFKNSDLPKQAVQHYKEALNLRPDHAEAHNNLGVILKEQGSSDKAISHFQQALTIRPNYVESYNNLAAALVDQGKLDEAISYYEKALLIAPGFPGTYYNLANALTAQGKLNVAVTRYKQALSINPAFVAAYNNLGGVLKELGQPDEALTLYKQAITITPTNAEAHFNMGNILADKGMTEAAIQHLRRCLEVDPADEAGARLVLASLGVEPMPERASDAHLQRLYDQRAHLWDAGTNTSQSYQGHHLVTNALREFYKGTAKLDILDAGCGTGLVGELVRDLARRLVGVDMSAAMLKGAQSKGVYDELHQDDLVAFLSERHASYDVITCAATLIHFGDLRAAFHAFAQALRMDGLFICTLFPNDREEETGGVVVAQLPGLAQGGCYAHGRNYITALAHEQGLSIEKLETHIHEYTKGEPRRGLLVVLRRPEH